MDPQDRRRLLIEEFEQIDADHDNVFNKQDLIRYLDRRSGGLQFDRHLANELFDKMEKDKDDRVSLNEFINIWAESENTLIRSVNELEFDIKDSQEKREKLRQKIAELKTARGKTIENSLRIVIREARSIEADSYIIAVSCQGQMQQTRDLTGRDAVVNHYVEYVLPKGSDQFITFQLLNVHSPAQSTLTGSIHTSILLDQLKHDEWILMQRMDGVRTDSRLLVTIQHLYSEEEYYKAMVGYWDQHIKKQNGNIERNKKYLQQIYNPNDFLMTVAHGDFYIKRLRPTQEMGSVETIDPAYTALRMTPPTAHHPMFSLAGLLGFGLVVMCMLMLYHRACFDTMAVGLLLIGFFFLKLDFTQKGLGITALFLVVSVIMDIAWIFAFRKTTFGDKYVDDGSLKTGRSWEMLLSWIMLLSKILVFALLFKLFQMVARSKQANSLINVAAQDSMATSNKRLGPSHYYSEGFFLDKPTMVAEPIKRQ